MACLVRTQEGAVRLRARDLTDRPCGVDRSAQGLSVPCLDSSRVERRCGMAEVRVRSPVEAPLQGSSVVERLAVNQCAEGSNPSLAARACGAP